MNLLRTMVARRELLWTLAMRELTIRYRGSLLGFLWTVLIPLFMAGIYFVFLRMLAGAGTPIADVIIGVFAWQFTVHAINSGMASIVSNTSLVKKVAFPRAILPVSATVAVLLNYLMSLVVQFPLVAVLLAMGGSHLSPLVLAFPLIVVAQFLFNLALAFLLGALNVYFRDTQHLVGVLLSAWFFVSPVMYDLSFVENVSARHPWVMDVYLLNPLATLITAYRAVSIPGYAMPPLWSLAALAGIIAAMLALGYAVFARSEKDFADWL